MQHLPLLMIIAIAATAGCGQKGPLVLPDAHTATPVVRPAPAPAVGAAGTAAAGATAVPAPPDTATPDKKKRPE